MIGRIGSQTVAAMQGRFHYYKCFSMQEVAYPVYVMKLLGIGSLIVTIAAGYLGMQVLGISCITNMATGTAEKKHAHEDVVRVANESSAKLCALVQALIENWDN